MRSWKCVTFLVPLFFVFCLASTASSAQMEDRLRELERKVEKFKSPQETSSKMADFIDRLNMSVEIGIWGTYTSPYKANEGKTSDIALDTLEVYFEPRLNNWIQGYVELEYGDPNMEGEEGRIIVKGLAQDFPDVGLLTAGQNKSARSGNRVDSWLHVGKQIRSALDFIQLYRSVLHRRENSSLPWGQECRSSVQHRIEYRSFFVRSKKSCTFCSLYPSVRLQERCMSFAQRISHIRKPYILLCRAY